ncbi:MAG: HDOD domain-containing protein [Verrucomicrobiales bacterium]|nr:HDOD domain-containing protein [Verrucomicrobiales bacterium]
MNRRTPSEFRDAIRKVRKLYSTPEVLAKVLRLLQKPDVDLEDVGGVIKNDSALVADLIRLSNSALFSRGGGCVDLQLALQRLGMQQVIRAVELSLSKNVFGKGLSNYGISVEQYWRTSVLAALLMEQLANIHGVDAPEAYTIGLLQSMGRVLINEVLEEVKCPAHWERTVSLETWEVHQVGFTHAEAGALLLREWGFPASLVAPIEHQLGAPTAVPAQTTAGMLRFVRILLAADPIATTHPNPPAFPPDLLGWSGFASEEEALSLLVEAQGQLAKIAEGLGMATPPTSDPNSATTTTTTTTPPAASA